MPAVNRVYLRNTQLNVGTGGIIYDLSASPGTNANLTSGNVNSTVFTEVFAFQLTTGASIVGTTFDTFFQITNFSGTGPAIRWRLQRVNSANVVQASSAYSQTESTITFVAATLTLSTTWAPGDRLRLSVELSRSGMGNATVTLGVNNLSSALLYTYRRVSVIS